MANFDAIVKKVIAQQLQIEVAKVTNEASFADLGADSLDQVEIVNALAEEFDIVIPDEEGKKITTVQGAINYMSADQ